MSFQTDVRDEIMSLVQDITGVEPYNSISAARKNIVEMLDKGSWTLPMYVVECGEFNSDDEWGVDSQSYRCPARIYAIHGVAGTDAQSSVQAVLESIRDAIDNGPTTSFQSIELGTISTGVDEAIMQPFIDNQNDLIGGSLSWTPGLLCGTNL